MQTNAFEDSRISEGTLHSGAYHPANIPINPAAMAGGYPGRIERPVRRVLGAVTLTGAGVRNPDGDSLGTIEDIMLDIGSGQIAYAVLSFGGFLGIGDKLFIVPWSALAFEHRSNEFILDVPRDLLVQAPGFDKDNWPDMADPARGREIHRYYSRTPYWENTMTDFSGDEFTANRCCE